MKKKSIKLMILTALVVASFTTNVVYAAKPNFNEKNTSVDHKQGNYNKNIKKIDQKQENYNKKTSREIYTLSKKLDQIENSYKKINVKLEEYFNETSDSETTTGSSITTDVSTETTTDSTETTDVSTGTTTNTQIGNGENQSGELGKEYDSEDSEDIDDIDEDKDIDEDMDEDEDEYREVSNSFYGKLNAVMNRLNTVKRQLNRIGSLDNEDISKLNSRTDELINQVKASMDRVAGIQSQNIQSLQKESDKKVMKDENITEQKKSWKIHFSKSIDPETINSKNVMIIDSKNNILDVDVSYNKDSNDIVIETKDGFVKSESYSILISSDVKSTDGKRLQRATEKRFLVK